MEKTNYLITKEHIISFYDLENFLQISKKYDTEGLFNFLNELQILVIHSLIEYEPKIIKNIGDSNLFIFSVDNVDKKIIALFNLKQKIEDFLKTRGFTSNASFSSHIGEITVGEFGIDPYKSIDAFGDSINITFKMNGQPFKGRFTISPQLFRRLLPGTRKLFHKYTPPIVYTAE